MALPIKQQAKYWGIVTLAFFAILYVLGDVILPFVLGMAVAYMLDPIADRLESWGLSRILATITITACAGLLFVLSVLLILPTLRDQLLGLFAIAPDLITDLRSFLGTRFPTLFDETSKAYQTLAQIGDTIQARGGEIIQTALGSVLSVFNVLMILVLVPVITFYLLMDWDRMIAEIDKLLPRDHAPVVRKLASQIDRTLASFIRGQGTVCLILGCFYAIALMAIGLNFGVAAGAIAGALTFIPYVGALVGGALSIGLALFQFWGEWHWIIAVVAIFAVGQFVEGNILTPNLVGSSIGLHPVWLIFALTAFGTLFGFVGMLIAVPVAASIGVLMRFGIEQYQSSKLYRGFEAVSLHTDEDEPAIADTVDQQAD